MDFALIIPAFIAGLFTFLAPCTLPLVPAYLSFISGISLDGLEKGLITKKSRVFFNGLLFVVGFSLVFVILGSLAGLGGRALIGYRQPLSYIGGGFVIFFGLFMTGVFKLPVLKKTRQFRPFKVFRQGRAVNSLILGSAFGLSWTPCIGPVLGSILTLAAVSSTVYQGALLLAVFSAGLAVPFLAVALSMEWFLKHMKRVTRYLKWTSIIGGLLLILLGILILTDKVGLWLSYSYQLLDFINYDKLLDFL